MPFLPAAHPAHPGEHIHPSPRRGLPLFQIFFILFLIFFLFLSTLFKSVATEARLLSG